MGVKIQIFRLILKENKGMKDFFSKYSKSETIRNRDIKRKIIFVSKQLK